MSALAREIRSIAGLAAPAALTQLGAMMLLVVDNVMLGRYSPDALAASSLGRAWLMGTSLLGLGILIGMDPLVSQAYGARDRARLSATLERGMLLALLLSVPIALLWLWTKQALVRLGQEPALAELARDYVLVQIPGLPCYFGFMVLRGWLQGRRIVRPALWAVILANGLNALANWALIWGNLGMPELGAKGAGIATCFTQIVTFAGFCLLVRLMRLGRGARTESLSWRARFAGLPSIVRLGLPVSLQLGFEMWAFHIATLWAGRIGKLALASHTIALNLASITFMVPLGISIGAATRVGNLMGAGRTVDAQRAAWVSLVMGGAVMSLAALAFVLGDEFLPSLYTEEVAVVAMAASVMPIAATFQLFDGLQVVGTGILRGMGRPRPAALFNLIAYYALGLPIAWWLAFEHGAGLAGIWWGLCAGLAVVALALTIWIGYRGPAHTRTLLPQSADS